MRTLSRALRPLPLPAMLCVLAGLVTACAVTPDAPDSSGVAASPPVATAAPRLVARLALPITEAEASELATSAPDRLVRPDDGGGPLRIVDAIVFTERDVIAVRRRSPLTGDPERAYLSITLDTDAAARLEAATTEYDDERRLQLVWDDETIALPRIMGTLSTAAGIMADPSTMDEIESALRGRPG